MPHFFFLVCVHYWLGGRGVISWGSISIFITYGAKLLNADWLRQRAFFLNHEGTFW